MKLVLLLVMVGGMVGGLFVWKSARSTAVRDTRDGRGAEAPVRGAPIWENPGASPAASPEESTVSEVSLEKERVGTSEATLAGETRSGDGSLVDPSPGEAGDEAPAVDDDGVSGIEPPEGAPSDAAPDRMTVTSSPTGVTRPDHPAAAPERQEEGAITFSLLASYDYAVPDPRTPAKERPDQIPDRIKALDGSSITIEGYMIPIEMKRGRVRSFYLSRNIFGCCFGDTPRVNEIIEVSIRGDRGVMNVPDLTVIVSGTLEVGEVFDEYGYLNSVYRILADAVTEPP